MEHTFHNLHKNLANCAYGTVLIFFTIFQRKLAHNVLAVTDVFLRPIRKNAKHFYGRKKMWRNKTP
jgi:hypothetical protein